MQTQIKKTTCKSESDQIGFFLLEAISLPLPYRITFTFKLAFPNLDSGHYQGGATTLGKITPPRTDSSHINWVLLGTPHISKTDEFSEKFQTVFDPPPLIFRKIILQIFPEIHDQSIVYNGKNRQYKFLD